MNPDLDHAWSRRGLVSPAPWGATLSSVWLDSEVTFSRQTPTPDGLGGFSTSQAPIAYLTAAVHVRFVGDGVSQGPYPVPSIGGTDTQKRMLAIRMETPDESLTPKKGDRVRFVLDTGVVLDLFITNVHSPRNYADHLKVETEWFE